MDDLETIAFYYLNRLAGPDGENAYHRLIEMDASIVPSLIQAFQTTRDTSVRADLVEIIWQHRLPHTAEFLAQALDDPTEEIWRAALDGLVSIGGESAVQMLELAKQRSRSDNRTDVRLQWIEEALQQIRDREQ